jgi:hypothetical protein
LAKIRAAVASTAVFKSEIAANAQQYAGALGSAAQTAGTEIAAGAAAGLAFVNEHKGAVIAAGEPMLMIAVVNQVVIAPGVTV